MFRAEDSGAAAVPEQTDCWVQYASPGLELGYGILTAKARLDLAQAS